MNRLRKAGAVVVLVIATGMTYFYVVAPFLWSESRLREKVLSLTPIGSTHEQVLKTIELQGWHPWLMKAEVANHGYFQQFAGAPGVEVGFTSISGSMGTHYENPIQPTYVSVHWGFGKDGRLTDVWIWKVTDSI